MSDTTISDPAITDPAVLIEELRAELRTLSDRLARLEKFHQSDSPHAASAPPAAATALSQQSVDAARTTVQEAPTEPISEEILMVISAAVAAFLGERAHIRQVRLIRSRAWAQQGRVSIQASHYLQT